MLSSAYSLVNISKIAILLLLLISTSLIFQVFVAQSGLTFHSNDNAEKKLVKEHI